jgi:hypothetical protein
MSIKIISCHPVFNENAVVLSQKFNWKLESQFDPQAGDIYLVLGGHEMAHQLLEVQFRKNSSFGYIIMNSEQIHSQFMKNKYYIQLMKRNVVFDYTTINTDYLRKTHDIKVLSYFFFEFLRVEKKNTTPKYDVTFIGSRNEDRVKLMKELEEEFDDLKFYIDFDWKHNSSNAMTEIMNDSKVVLNIGYYSDYRPLESHRINKALACHCDVVSVMSNDDDANEFYKDYCYMTTDIKDTLHKYFNNELEPKKPYEDLVKTLAQKFHPHMMFIVDHIQKKLLSIHNNNGTTTEVVSQSSSTDTTVSSNTSEEVKTGE